MKHRHVGNIKYSKRKTKNERHIAIEIVRVLCGDSRSGSNLSYLVSNSLMLAMSYKLFFFLFDELEGKG